MRTLYLIRHAHISFPKGATRCISETDIPLDWLGTEQSERLREWAHKLHLEAVFTSPIGRCVQTAEIMADRRIPVRICAELSEMSVGEWENMTFDEIRRKYPDEYSARGKRLGTVPPPGGESFVSAGKRLISYIETLLAETKGDIAVVAHGGINRGALCLLSGRNPDKVMEIIQPYGGINALEIDKGGKCSVLYMGKKPDRFPPEFELKALLSKYRTPSAVKAHCKAVAETAALLATQIPEHLFDAGLLKASCELHDLVRVIGGNHAERGAELLLKEGYPDVAEIISAHHDLPDNAGTETCLLYLADKLVLGTRRVTLQERFANSKQKCVAAEALEVWQRRLDDALEIIERYQINMELIK